MDGMNGWDEWMGWMGWDGWGFNTLLTVEVSPQYLQLLDYHKNKSLQKDDGSLNVGHLKL
jgi:hypothetical protein